MQRSRKQQHVSLPKSPQSGYRFFCLEYRAVVADAFPRLQSAQVQGLLLRCWRELPSELKQPFHALAKQDRERYQRQLHEFSTALADEGTDDEQQPHECNHASRRSRKRRRSETTPLQRGYVLFLREMTEAAQEQLARLPFNEFQQRVACEWKRLPPDLRQHWVDKATVEDVREAAEADALERSGCSLRHCGPSAQHTAINEQVLKTLAALPGVQVLTGKPPKSSTSPGRSDGKEKASDGDPPLSVTFCRKSLAKATGILAKLCRDVSAPTLQTALKESSRRMCVSKKINPFSIFAGALKFAAPAKFTDKSFNQIQSYASTLWKTLSNSQKQVFGRIAVRTSSSNEDAESSHSTGAMDRPKASALPKRIDMAALVQKALQARAEPQDQEQDEAEEYDQAQDQPEEAAAGFARPARPTANVVISSSHDDDVVQALFTMSEAALASPMQMQGGSAKKRREESGVMEQNDQQANRLSYFHTDSDLYQLGMDQFGIHQMSAEEIGAAATMTALGGAMAEADAEFELLDGEAEQEAEVLRLLASGMWHGSSFDLS